MRKEVLRLERVTVEENDFLLLDNFSLHVFEGEIFGLVCFNFHGRDALLRLLERNEPLHYGFVYLGEKLVNAYGKSDLSYNKVLFIDSTGGLADSLTVAENIFVLRYGFRKRLVSRRVLEKQVEILSRETGIPVEPGRYVAELSFYEKCCVALLKAYATGAKLVVVRDISHFLSTADLREFQKQMRKLAEHGVMCDRHSARQLTNRDYNQYDLLIGMDQANLRNMHCICGGDHAGKMHLLMDFTGRPGDVADPWYTGDFEVAWQDVLEGCQGLLERINPREA